MPGRRSGTSGRWKPGGSSPPPRPASSSTGSTRPFHRGGLLAANQNLAIQFWIVFSRFEYALKREDYALGDQTSISAHWDKFAADLAGVWNADRTPELRAAVDYFFNQPPKKQTLQGGTLEWTNSVIAAHEPELKRLLLYVRRVRNNLFHGGKFTTAMLTAPERDTDLIRNSLIILDECLTLCEQAIPGIHVRFMEPAP